MRKKLQIFISILLAVQPMSLAGTLVLKRAWIEKFKDRATIDVQFTVDHAHKKANAPKDDGDMHVAGRAPKEVGLPMVAELMNAASEGVATGLIHQNEGSGQFVPLSGAWRLWFEHPGESQTQFDSVPKAGNTNPDHSFEIHPISKFNGQDVTGSLHFVQGFTAHPAAVSFGSYEKKSVSIRSTKTAVALGCKKSGFNYTHFRMRLIGKPAKLKDGGVAVLADVLNDQDGGEDVLVSKLRMIFVPGTVPWQKIQNADDGDEFDALGIPRVNLNAISTFIGAASTVTITRKLPYEIIVVGLQ